MESVKASATLALLDIFLNKTQWALCVSLQDETQKWLSVTATVLMDLKTILNQEPSIHGLPHP